VRKIATKQLEVQIDVKNDKVVYAANEALINEEDRRLSTFQDTGQLHSPRQNLKQVIEVAEKAVTAMGQSIGPDLRLKVTQFDAKRGCWELTWFRYIQEYLFDEEVVAVTVDDPTMKVALYSNTVTGITCQAEVRLARDKAKAIAMSRMSVVLQHAAGNEPFRIEEDDPPMLYVVYANGVMAPRAEPLKLLKDPKPEAHLVYAFHFVFAYAGKSQVHPMIPPAYVWVDASSGAVVGGR
jgi:hypothetical protein